MATFTKDIEEIRKRAVQKIEDGAVTDSYKLDKEQVVEILNEALATEIVCVLRYQHHYFMATGVHGRSVAKLFKSHADEEREHADEIAERIQQLGGKPNFNPKDLVQRSVSQYIEGETLADMIREDLIAERIVIDVYQRMIEYFGMKDPTTRTLIEHIKGEEEEHASELSDMMFIVNPKTGEEEGQDPGTNPLHRREEHANQGAGPKASQSPSSKSKISASSEEEEVDDSEEQTFTRDWGNEANVGKQGAGSPARRSTAPVETGWGNEANVGKSEGREAQSRKAAEDTKAASFAKRNTEPAGRLSQDKKSAKVASGPGKGMIPGVGGRPMNRRKNEKLEIDIRDVAKRPNRGASSGTNKSPRILQKKGKSKRAA